MRYAMTGLLLAGCVDKGSDGDDTGEGGLVLSPGFGAETLSGTAAGEAEDATCDAWFPASPQHTVALTEPFAGLYAEADTTAVVLQIRYGASTFCSDLDSGLPRVERGSWSAGDYEIYVGTPNSGETAAYTLTIYESP